MQTLQEVNTQNDFHHLHDMYTLHIHDLQTLHEEHFLHEVLTIHDLHTLHEVLTMKYLYHTQF